VENGVAYFLLIYYNQVLGLSAGKVGFALLVALIFDAVSDPLVGYWSDRTNSKIGRRHPFLYASIVPAAFLYFLLWEPTADSDTGLFIHLLVTIIGVRLSVTFFSVPSYAMIPELTDLYDERTRLMNYLYSSSWLVGTIFAVAMYAIWLADSPEHPIGVMNEQGYRSAGRIAAVTIAVAAFVMAYVSRVYAPRLRRTPIAAESWRVISKELRETVGDSSFMALVTSSTIRFAAGGASTALWAYMQPYFWEFNSDQIATLLAVQILSAVVAFFAVPLISHKQNKRTVLVSLIVILGVVSAAPVCLRLLGWFPENGTPALFPIMAAAGVAQVSLIIMTGTMSGSMLMDVVEHREIVTRRREEGLLLSVQSFMSKVSTGLGAWLAGMLLLIVNFPQGDSIEAVPPDTIYRLGVVYGPVLAVFYVTAALALLMYRIDRKTHLSNVDSLRN
jgi:Na+/melibiose symporter-like transporter